MLDHLSLNLSAANYTKSLSLYKAALATLNIKLVANYQDYYCFGRESDSLGRLWTYPCGNAIAPTHLCFIAENKEQVDNFYQTALANGAKDNGAPGERPHFFSENNTLGKKYYAAFVLDLDGNNIEACFRNY